MDTHEIPPEQWLGYLDQFSRMHRGQPAMVRTDDPAGGAQFHAEDLPLIGVSPERGRQAEPAIRVMLEAPPNGHISHLVPAPAHLRVAEWNDAVSALLEIESSDGRTTVVQVGPAEQVLPPGFVTDGLYEQE